MSSRPLILAVAAAAPLLALGVQAQAQPYPGLSRTCHFLRGPRAGTTVEFSRSPGTPEVPIGSHCGDMSGSNGVAVANPSRTGRTPGPGRFYRSPGAPLGMWGSGQVQRGFTLSCRFTSGPRAGSVGDFSRTLGATPIRLGSRCSDGASRGFGVGGR
jgi:hypothetical protein